MLAEQSTHNKTLGPDIKGLPFQYLFRLYVVLCTSVQASVQGGIITRILASGMQRSLETWAKFSADLMQNDANSVKTNASHTLF